MSGMDHQQAPYRRKRVQRLKKIIIWLIVTLVVMPNVCCILLLVRMNSIERRLDQLSTQLEQWMQLELERQETEAVPQESRSVSVQPEVIAAKPEDNISEVIEWEPQHKVYLTFDDGPSIYTDEILDILNEYGVKATFFVVGKEDAASQEAIRRIVEEGHTLGMHSYSHKYSEIYKSVEAFSEDFHQIQDYLYDLTGVQCVYYRFPGGSSNTVSPLNMQNFADYLDAQGVTYYDWNIASGDGGSRLLNTDTLLHNSTDDVNRWQTSIVLLHDSANKPTTVEALPGILENILAMEDTVILPITEETVPVQHIHIKTNE
ncbi:MAG: polysaccharide deacetylase [Acetatifactor sp.]|nr:polysaccharide deacetylase [Acetatifactor sp.]